MEDKTIDELIVVRHELIRKEDKGEDVAVELELINSKIAKRQKEIIDGGIKMAVKKEPTKVQKTVNKDEIRTIADDVIAHIKDTYKKDDKFAYKVALKIYTILRKKFSEA